MLTKKHFPSQKSKTDVVVDWIAALSHFRPHYIHSVFCVIAAIKDSSKLGKKSLQKSNDACWLRIRRSGEFSSREKQDQEKKNRVQVRERGCAREGGGYMLKMKMRKMCRTFRARKKICIVGCS